MPNRRADALDMVVDADAGDMGVEGAAVENAVGEGEAEACARSLPFSLREEIFRLDGPMVEDGVFDAGADRPAGLPVRVEVGQNEPAKEIISAVGGARWP